MDDEIERDEVLFDRSALHTGAAAALDRDGTDLLAAKQVGDITNSEPPFPSRRQVAKTITDADLISEPMMAWSDLAGRTVGRYFVQDGWLVALRDEGYMRLRRLAEKVLRTKPFSHGLSSTFVEEETFRWWRATLRGQTDMLLSAHLLEAADAVLARHSLIIPLVNIECPSSEHLAQLAT